MGKVSKLRQKAHKATVSTGQNKSADQKPIETPPIMIVPSHASKYEKPISKKDKARSKRDNLLHKIKAIQKTSSKSAARKRQRAAKKTLKTDLNPLLDALPSLDSLLKIKSKTLKTGVPEYDDGDGLVVEVPPTISRNEKAKRKNAEFNDRFAQYQKVISNAAFKKNPRAAIVAHLKNKQIYEQQIEICQNTKIPQQRN